jgi:hypothetical protein
VRGSGGKRGREGIRSMLVEEISGFEWEVCGVSDAHSGFRCFGED